MYELFVYKDQHVEKNNELFVRNNIFLRDIHSKFIIFFCRLKIKRKALADILQLRVTVVQLQLNENVIKNLNSYSVSNGI